MTFVIPYPAIDPVLFAFGPIAIRWYSLAYIFGLILGWRYIAALAKRPAPGQAVAAGPEAVDDYLVWATLGVVLGGRLGYVLFYKPDFYFANPAAILKVWQGGMSFHGGLLGVIVATMIFVRLRRIPLLAFGDLIACAAPIGIFLGRSRQFHQRRIIRPGDRRSLGHGLSPRRPGTPPPEPALRSDAGRPGSFHRPLSGLAQ